MGTGLAGVHAADLGAAAAAAALRRAGVTPDEVDEVIVGNIAGPPDTTNIARVVALRAGVPDAVPAHTVNRNCASALQAVADAAMRVETGLAEVVLAGGTESMSRVPFIMPDSFTARSLALARARSAAQRLRGLLGYRPRDLRPRNGLLVGLRDAACGLSMGQTAEVLVRELGMTREEQDGVALESHLRAERSRSDGHAADEIVPVADARGRSVDTDNGIRAGQTLEALARLRPVFEQGGTVTAGNSSQVTDGAAMVLVVSERRARSGQPLGRIVSWDFAGLDPSRMGLGPTHAAPRALDRAGLTLERMDRIELNEAFAAVVLANRAAMASGDYAREHLGRTEPVGELDLARTNVNGGAIALGHPVGATGARLVLTLLNELRRNGGRHGLATLCVGGGQGGAMVLEVA
jgi:acetyl-CoA acetyltransferase family protein